MTKAEERPAMAPGQARAACTDYLLTCVAWDLVPSPKTALDVIWCANDADRELVARTLERVLAEARQNWRRGRGRGGMRGGRRGRAGEQQQLS